MEQPDLPEKQPILSAKIASRLQQLHGQRLVDANGIMAFEVDVNERLQQCDRSTLTEWQRDSLDNFPTILADCRHDIDELLSRNWKQKEEWPDTFIKREVSSVLEYHLKQALSFGLADADQPLESGLPALVALQVSPSQRRRLYHNALEILELCREIVETYRQNDEERGRFDWPETQWSRDEDSDHPDNTDLKKD